MNQTRSWLREMIQRARGRSVREMSAAGCKVVELMARLLVYQTKPLKSLRVKATRRYTGEYYRTYRARTSASALSQSSSGEPGRSARSSQIR